MDELNIHKEEVELKIHEQKEANELLDWAIKHTNVLTDKPWLFK